MHGRPTAGAASEDRSFKRHRRRSRPAHAIYPLDVAAKNPAFKRAVEHAKLMTLLHPHAGAAKDYALVGYHPEEGATYLMFPRSLKPYAGKRVVGIRYDLVAA